MYGKSLKNKVLVGVMLFLMVITLSFESVQAYDLDAGHSVNISVDIEETKSTIWKTIRSWGFSEAATAGIMGNIEAECGYNYTAVQDSKGWSDFSKGSVGIGIVQWTTSDRQQGLFDLCDSKEVQWTDLETQLEWLKTELDGATGESTWWKYGDNCNTYEDFKNLNNVYTAADVMCWGFERPDAATADIDRRKESAKAAFEQFTGTTISEAGNSDMDISSSLIISEWSLVGMPAKSGLMTDYENVVLPDSESLEQSEKYSISIIKDNIVNSREVHLFDLIRVTVVFLGLVLIIYSVLLIVAYMFDKTNNMFEFSLLKVMTLGAIQYYDEDDKGKKGYISQSKLTKISVLCMVVGFFIISGGVFAWILDFYYWFSEVL